MPHSLRAKLKCLRYKRIITDMECDRIHKALDSEGILDKIKAEIQAEKIGYPPNADEYKTINKVLQVIDKYKEDHK